MRAGQAAPAARATPTRQAAGLLRIKHRAHAKKAGPARHVLRATVLTGTQATARETTLVAPETHPPIVVGTLSATVEIHPEIAAVTRRATAAGTRLETLPETVVGTRWAIVVATPGAIAPEIPVATEAETLRAIAEAWVTAQLPGARYL